MYSKLARRIIAYNEGYKVSAMYPSDGGHLEHFPELYPLEANCGIQPTPRHGKHSCSGGSGDQ